MEKYGIGFRIFPYSCNMINRIGEEKLKKLAARFKSIAVNDWISFLILKKTKSKLRTITKTIK